MVGQALLLVSLMTDSVMDSAVSTRDRNKAKRREAILTEARMLIATDGCEGLKLRDLAQRAGVTTPTIYNLVGGKDDILNVIIEQLVERLQGVQDDLDFSDPVAAYTEQMGRFETLFSSDPTYYRAAFIAGDRKNLFEQQSSTGIYARSLEQPIAACKAAIKSKLLRGTIAPQRLAQQVYGCYRLARQDWTLGHIPLSEFKNQALTGIFLTLAADATPAFREELLKTADSLT